MNFWKQFKPKCCSVRLKADSKDSALEELIDNMVKGGALPEGIQEPALRALREREREASTGIGMGVAIPHVKVQGLDRVACSLSVHPEGLEWASVDGEAASIFFTVLRPLKAGEHHDPERHLEMMRWIARLSRDGDFRRFAQRVKTKTELVDLLKEMSTV